MHCERASSWVLIALFVSLLVVGAGCGKEDTSEPDVDTTPPIVSSATGIDVYHVEVVFNEKVEESSSENSSHYSITPAGGGSPVTISSVVLLADEKTVSIETSAQASVSYVLSVTAVKDLAGNAMGTQTLGFEGSSELDTTAPVVASTDPEDGERGVDTTATVTAEFSEKMNRTSVETSFYVQRASGGGNLAGSFVWEAGDTRVVFTPASHLGNYATYYAGVNTGATDVTGNHLASAYAWSFVTGDAGAVSGTIEYSGTPPYTSVNIVVFRDLGFRDPVASAIMDGPGSYTIDPVPPGTCYVGAFMDLNLSGEPDAGEPCGMYDTDDDAQPDPITVSAGHTRSGVNFELEYQFQYSTISGTVSKGEVTESDTTYVVFFADDPTQGGAGEPVDVQVLPLGFGAYTSSPLFFGCYYVMCYMDTNHNHKLDPDEGPPIEPVGIYGELVGEEPVLTPILLITDTVGINMTLFYFPSSP
ncbi:MAG: Ig-like domain-containing protein [Candidatus Eisenbacteria bacterium]|nr:Ig-like domain-containing protein [Candidatus Eisenbacteria bacterium]